MMPELNVSNLSKYYGDVRAVDNIDLTVRDGEFLTLLGPSGCGKSTTLFAIAGLDTPSLGRISMGDDVFFDAARGYDRPPERRNCGLVFQSYALWPHMTVSQNLAFPLKIRKVVNSERQRRIRDVLKLVEMQDYQDRYPHELSGGQQQRVALARTIVFEPSILLLDEPLSNLDAKLRIRARIWLRELQQRLSLTTIYVTHDQTEALSMSDRIAVMNEGKIVQLASPKEIFTRPANAFVADFIGSSNFLEGKLVSRTTQGDAVVRLADGISISATSPSDVQIGTDILVAIRPEYISLASGVNWSSEQNSMAAKVIGRSYLGSRYQYNLKSPQGNFSAESDVDFSTESLFATFKREHAVIVGQ